MRSGTRAAQQATNFRRIVAVSLLLVFMTGLSITTCTQGWLNSLPYHDHLLSSTRALGIVHHTHHGDELDRAQRAMTSLIPVRGQVHDDGILSLQPLTAQPELNTFTAQGWGGGMGLPLVPEVGLVALALASLIAVGRRSAPPSPPPRFA